MKTIKMRIKNGRCHIETDGFTRGECLEATAPLKQLIGEEAEEPKLKDEYFQEEVTEDALEYEEF